MKTIFADELYDAHKDDCFIIRGKDGTRYFPPFPKCQVKFGDETVQFIMYKKKNFSSWFNRCLQNDIKKKLAFANMKMGTQYRSFRDIPPFISAPQDILQVIDGGRKGENYLLTAQDFVYAYQQLCIFHKKQHFPNFYQPLTKDGNIIPGAYLQSINKKIAPKVFAQDEQAAKRAELIEAMNKDVVFSLFAISVMNCQNIQVDEVPARERIHHRGCRAGDRQYVLTVRPMAKQKQYESTGRPSQGKSSEMALHVRRGHFGDYTKGRGLFGRINGVFWFSDTTIGNQKNGIIKKDYKLPNAPTS